MFDKIVALLQISFWWLFFVIVAVTIVVYFVAFVIVALVEWCLASYHRRGR